MPAATDYLSAIRAKIPRIRVDDELQRELERRAAAGQDVNRVVQDAYGFDKVAQGEEDAAQAAAAAQVDPGARTAETDLTNERTLAETSARRLQEEIARVYARRRENDPLARQGIVSGAALNAQTEEEATQVREVGTDLNNKLSYIAKRLSDAKTNASTQKAGLVSSLKDQYLQERQGSQRQYQADAQAAEDRTRGNAVQGADLYLKFLQADAPVPRDIYELIRRLGA